MRTPNIYVLVIAVFIVCTCTYAFGEDPNTSPSSSWKVGDSWKVRSWHSTGGYSVPGKKTTPSKIDKKHPYTIDFEVSGIKSLDDFEVPYRPPSIPERVKYDKLVKDDKIKKGEIECFEVRVTFPVDYFGFQQRYLLYFRKDKGNLIRIADFCGGPKSKGDVMRRHTDYSLDFDGPILVRNLGIVFFDWPDWREDQITMKDKDGEKDSKRLITQKIKTKNLIDAKGKSYKGREVTMKRIYKKSESEEMVRVKTVQHWKNGAKWWEEVKRYDERGKLKLIAEAVLLRN